MWFGMIVFLFWGGSNRTTGSLRGTDELLGTVKLNAESSWMSVYIGGNKVGFVHSELSLRADGGYDITEVSRMDAAMMGAPQQMRLKMSVVTDSTLALVSFEGSLDASPYLTTFSGKHSNQVLQIELTTGGKTSSRVLPAPEPIYLSQAIKPLLEAGRLGANDSLKLSGFDPLSLEMQELVVFGANREIHSLFGEQVEARKLVTRMGGFESSLYIDEEGNSLAEFGPMGIVLRREDMNNALALGSDNASVDFLDLFAIKPTGSIPNSRQTVKVKYRVSGIPVELLTAASSRQYREGVDTILVDAGRIRSESPENIDSTTLKDAPFIESRDPAIRSAAIEAMRGGTNRSDSLDKLSNWVFRSIAKKPSAGIPSALAVLKERSGDCNEHSVLFTALARSVGIPTRIQLGVVYQAGRFYYHAWPSCLIDGRWEEFEPTFGDHRADASRLAFASGDLSSAGKIAGVIGKIRIDILEVDGQQSSSKNRRFQVSGEGRLLQEIK